MRTRPVPHPSSSSVKGEYVYGHEADAASTFERTAGSTVTSSWNDSMASSPSPPLMPRSAHPRGDVTTLVKDCDNEQATVFRVELRNFKVTGLLSGTPHGQEAAASLSGNFDGKRFDLGEFRYDSIDPVWDGDVTLIYEIEDVGTLAQRSLMVDVVLQGRHGVETARFEKSLLSLCRGPPRQEAALAFQTHRSATLRFDAVMEEERPVAIALHSLSVVVPPHAWLVEPGDAALEDLYHLSYSLEHSGQAPLESGAVYPSHQRQFCTLQYRAVPTLAANASQSALLASAVLIDVVRSPRSGAGWDHIPEVVASFSVPVPSLIGGAHRRGSTHISTRFAVRAGYEGCITVEGTADLRNLPRFQQSADHPRWQEPQPSDSVATVLHSAASGRHSPCRLRRACDATPPDTPPEAALYRVTPGSAPLHPARSPRCGPRYRAAPEARPAEAVVRGRERAVSPPRLRGGRHAPQAEVEVATDFNHNIRRRRDELQRRLEGLRGSMSVPAAGSARGGARPCSSMNSSSGSRGGAALLPPDAAQPFAKRRIREASDFSASVVHPAAERCSSPATEVELLRQENERLHAELSVRSSMGAAPPRPDTPDVFVALPSRRHAEMRRDADRRAAEQQASAAQRVAAADSAVQIAEQQVRIEKLETELRVLRGIVSTRATDPPSLPLRPSRAAAAPLTPPRSPRGIQPRTVSPHREREPPPQAEPPTRSKYRSPPRSRPPSPPADSRAVTPHRHATPPLREGGDVQHSHRATSPMRQAPGSMPLPEAIRPRSPWREAAAAAAVAAPQAAPGGAETRVALCAGRDVCIGVAGCDYFGRDIPALLKACAAGDVEFATRYYKAAEPCNEAVVSRCFTPLHAACAASPNPALVTLLLQHGCDANAASSEGDTPLHLLASCPHPSIECLAMLLQAGAGVSAYNDKGLAPLHLAALNAADSGQKFLRFMIYQGGADINQRTQDGLSALQLCTPDRRPDVHMFLLGGGAK